MVVDANIEEVQALQLPVGEEIQNSLSVAVDGEFIVSDYAMYRFEQDGAICQFILGMKYMIEVHL